MSAPRLPSRVTYVGDPDDGTYYTRQRLDVDTTDPKVRKLLGPKGETLRTFSDRPPVGFHQGERER